MEVFEKKLIEAKCANKTRVDGKTLVEYEEWVNTMRTEMEEQKQRIQNLKEMMQERNASWVLLDNATKYVLLSPSLSN